jgi:hypothetical protein
MALVRTSVKPQDGKFITAYWQKTKEDTEIGSLVVEDGARRRIKCSYNTQIDLATVGDFGLVSNAKVLDMCTSYNIKMMDWIYIGNDKYVVDKILEKKPFQESNMYLNKSVIWSLRILIK